MKSRPTDIIVTTPLAASEAAKKEAQQIKEWGGGYYLRRISSKPQAARPGNRIFYVDKGAVRGFGIIKEFRFEEAPRPYPKYPRDGYWVVLIDATTWKWIRPIPIKGFQGFRYAYLDFEVVGNWLDPMPA